jgi:uncharacterized protein DUF4070
MPALTLVRGYRTVLGSLYSAENFFARLKGMISSLKGGRNKTLGRLNLATRIKWTIPLSTALFKTGRYRKLYFEFMLWVMQNHPDKWLFALTRALTGFHFIRYTELVMIPRLTLVEQELQEHEEQQQVHLSKRAG